MTTELARRDDDMPLAQLGETFARAKWFGLDPAQVVVKVLAGRELGLGAFASVTGIHLVQGRPELSANTQAILLKRSGRYDYRVRELTEKACAIEFFTLDGGKRESLGVSTFTMQDAEKAKLSGKEVWKAFPRNMLFARAITNGVGWFCPDAFGGLRVYAEGEVGGEERAPEVDEEPRAVRAEVVQGPRPRGSRRAAQDTPSLALPGPTVDAPASPPRVESHEAREIARPAPKAAPEDDVELRKKLRGRLYALVTQKFGQLADDGSSVKAREACGVASVKDATNAQLQHGIAVLAAFRDYVEPKVATASQPLAHRAPVEPYTAAAGIARGLPPEVAKKLESLCGDEQPPSLAALVDHHSREVIAAARAAAGIPAGKRADAAESWRYVMRLPVLPPKAAVADAPAPVAPTRAEVLARKLGGSPEAVKLGAEMAEAEVKRTKGSGAGAFSVEAGRLLALRLKPLVFDALVAAHPGLEREDPVSLGTVLAFVDAAPDAAGAPLVPQTGA